MFLKYKCKKSINNIFIILTVYNGGIREQSMIKKNHNLLITLEYLEELQ